MSWNWGSGAPGGKVAEKKTEGEIAIKSKRGNTIKKNASKDDPAIHIERSGNDVVKRASELNVEKKAHGGGDKKRKSEAGAGKSGEGDDDLKVNEEGKEVKSSGKKQKTSEKKEPEKKEAVNGEKKGKGRPKGSSSGPKKEKKAATPRSSEGVGSRTRSRA